MFFRRCPKNKKKVLSCIRQQRGGGVALFAAIFLHFLTGRDWMEQEDSSGPTPTVANQNKYKKPILLNTKLRPWNTKKLRRTCVING